MKWTDEEVQVLTEMAEAGLTLKDILRVMPYRSRHSIDNKIAVLGLSLGVNKNKPDFEIFLQMMKDAKKVKEL